MNYELYDNYNIKKKLVVDIVSGCLAAISFSPVVYIIDSSVCSTQSNKYTMKEALKVYSKRFNIFSSKSNLLSTIKQPPFYWGFFVYASTYTTNNIIETYCDSKNINNFFPKLIGVSFVNISMCLFKEGVYAVHNGVINQQKVPFKSYLCWILRDILAMTNAFILPERIAYIINNNFNNKNNFDKNKDKDYSIKTRKLVQLLVPIFNILLCTPLYLLGLDMYNNNKSNIKNRYKRVVTNYPKVVPITFARMTLAYGLGGINNINIRNKLNNNLN